MPRLVMLTAFAIGAAALIVSTACGSSTGKRPSSTSTRPAGTTPSSIVLTILSPEDGSKVGNPLTLQAQAAGIQIAVASEQEPGAAHFHAFLDKDPVAEGQVIPSGSGIYHFTDSVELRAATGEHKVVVVLGDNNHVRLREAPTAEVNFTIE